MQINTLTTPLEYNSAIHAQPEIAIDAKELKTKSEVIEPKVDKTENIETLKNIFAEHKITLKFSQDLETKQLVVELVDDKTGEAVRQIPSQISLKLAAIFVKMQGQFVDKKE